MTQWFTAIFNFFLFMDLLSHVEQPFKMCRACKHSWKCPKSNVKATLKSQRSLVSSILQETFGGHESDLWNHKGNYNYLSRCDPFPCIISFRTYYYTSKQKCGKENLTLLAFMISKNIWLLNASTLSVVHAYEQIWYIYSICGLIKKKRRRRRRRKVCRYFGSPRQKSM